MTLPEPRERGAVVEGVGLHVGITKKPEIQGIMITSDRKEGGPIDFIHGLSAVASGDGSQVPDLKQLELGVGERVLGLAPL